MIVVAFVLALQGTTQATVQGAVRDAETGRPLVNATVLLTNLNQSVTTGDSGRYALHNVPAGPQHITYRRIGYAPRTLDALVPRDGSLEIHVTLRPYPVQLPPINVTTPAIPSVPEGNRWSFVDHSTSLADMRNHPLLAEPDALQAIAGGEVVMDPESPNGVHIRGGGSDQTAYLLDGIPVFSPYHVAGTFTAWNPDAIAGLELSASSPAPGLSETTSGVIAANTRTPGDRHTLQGSISTSQVRGTLDGPLAGDVRYLISGRTGFVPGFAPSNDASQVGSEAGDWLGKVEAPLLGGQARVLGYYASNEISADAAGGGLPVNPDILRNDFSWQSLSVGGEYHRMFSDALLRLVGWNAEAEAGARWNGESAVLDLDASRRDVGVLLSATLDREASSTLLGIRFERSRTTYVVRSDSAGLVLPNLHAVTPVATLFGQHARAVGRNVTAVVGSSLSRADHRWYVSPRVQVHLRTGPLLTLSGSASRLHQFGQSLRNPESVVGLVFPPDLYIGVEAPGVPVARSDQATLSAELTPIPGLRINLRGYHRDLRGILLIAPGEPEPFATRPLTEGTSNARGVALRVTVSTRRYSLIGSYGIQRVRLEQRGSSFVPNHGATHLFEGGIVVFPSATTSVRVGASGAVGRRTTLFTGALEWEACNLLDQGCEFAGSPHYGQDPIGAISLPTYFRLDASVRKHWHLRIAGREAMVALFGTATNLLARRNLLTYARSPVTGELTEIEMRPLAPLVVGVDWRF
jgi:hypothetical protein